MLVHTNLSSSIWPHPTHANTHTHARDFSLPGLVRRTRRSHRGLHFQRCAPTLLCCPAPGQERPRWLTNAQSCSHNPSLSPSSGGHSLTLFPNVYSRHCLSGGGQCPCDSRTRHTELWVVCHCPHNAQTGWRIRWNIRMHANALG